MKENIKKFSFFKLPERVSEVENKVAELGQGAGGVVTWESISGKPATFAPTIGTTASTAKAGNYQPTWDEVSGKPTTFPPTIGTTSTTAKAGNYTPSEADIPALPTSKITSGVFAIAQIPTGTTGTTVSLGNHNHSITADATSGLEAAANLQALAVALSTRIKALEDAMI